MRRAFLALLILPLAARAQVRDSTISASASKTARVIPDRASMYVVVEGSAETTADALARVDTKVKAVVDALKALGSRAEVDRPMAYSVSLAPREQSYPQMPTSLAYIARSVIRVQTGRTDEIASISAAAIGGGASSISSLTFETTVADSMKRARLREALASARADAEAIATSLGGRLGSLVEVTSTSNQGFQNQGQLVFDTRFGGGFPSATPEIVITANVTVRYRLIR